MEEVISLEKAILDHFDGELQCRNIDLVETLPPPGQEIEAIVGSESATSTDEDPDLRDVVVTGTFQKDLAHSRSPRSLHHVKRGFAFLEASFGDCVETVSNETPLHNKHNLSFLQGGSKGSTSAPNESPPKLLEGAHNRSTELPSHTEKGNTDMTDLNPITGEAKAKTGSSPSQGLVSTSSGKKGTAPLLQGLSLIHI